MKKTAVYKLIKRFSEGREEVTDEKKVGQPVTRWMDENIVKVVKLCVQIGDWSWDS